MKNNKYLLLTKCVNDTYINNKKVSWKEFDEIFFNPEYKQVCFSSYIDENRHQLVQNWKLEEVTK